jgi:hypothetical protein
MLVDYFQRDRATGPGKVAARSDAHFGLLWEHPLSETAAPTLPRLTAIDYPIIDDSVTHPTPPRREVIPPTRRWMR